jgi:origin recognition complex subunit 3
VQMFKVMEPVICEMYRILKETGVTTNIYDFYQVFKSSIIMKKKVVEILNKKLLLGKDKFKEEEFDELRQVLDAIGGDDDAEGCDAWDKITLAWFLKSLAEFQMLGLIREGGSKSQSLEKVIWRGI